jgi:hypothetical protein
VQNPSTKSEQHRQAVADRLAREFQEAKIAYDSATEQYQRTVTRTKELPLASPNGNRAIASADGDLSLTEALTVQSEALEKVSLALRAFNRFVVYGEGPDGTESPIGSEAKAKSFSDGGREFEDAYREALVCLADVGHVVAGPIGTDGSRVCIVDGKPLTDYEVLNLWWGKEIADQIRRERQP